MEIQLPEILKSKKGGIGIVALVALIMVNAPAWQIMAIGILGIITQGVLDFRKLKNNNNSGEEYDPENQQVESK